MSAEGPRHWRNVVVIWLIANVIMVPIVIFVLGPGLPPGNGSVEASGQVTDNTVLLATATPVALGVLVYLGYVLFAFREREPEAVLDGPPIRGDSSVQFWWLIVTTTLVLFLAGYGTVRLLADGSGGGQGPNPIATPSVPAGGKRLVVQVVAQQWQFNYRFPGYGGVETNQIELPENTLVQFNVTSLDVIHSFWAYELGVKADANPIATPSVPAGGKRLVVQVVAQQWQFNYRFPGYGGVETNQIELPENTLVQFNVTSLDVIHSFWAYELGVKADANPGVNNVAYVTTKGPLIFHVRCAELCGLWHGYMFNQGRVVPKTQFAVWIAQQRVKFAPATKTLPPYSKTYFPDPQRRAG